jgi:glycosyltransferase involved in cell wall biosynthesis
MNQPFFSICIPIWGAKGEGIDYLEHNLTSIKSQTFTDFEVVISDHSIDNSLQDFVELWESILNITYIRCDKGRGLISPNCNNALKHASGKYIKILYQDDIFYNEHSLNYIAKYLNKNPQTNWLVTGCIGTYDMINVTVTVNPQYHQNIHLGSNSIGCPSVLTLKNSDEKIYLDENLRFLDDVEFYKRLYDKYGLPNILPTICSTIRMGGVSATSLLNDEIRKKEYDLMVSKYGIL